MATPKGYTFNADSARRIADVVKRVEGQPTSATGTPSGISGLTVTRQYHVRIGSPRGPGKYDATLLTASESEIDPDGPLTAEEIGTAHTPDGDIEVVACNTLAINGDNVYVPPNSVWPCFIIRRPTPDSPVLYVSFAGFGFENDCSTS